MGRARGGRVRASPPFCESITRSRWVGSCYSGASTPSPAGLLCVQWTGKYCLSALPDDLLALHLSPRRRPGLFEAAARASLRLRPGSRAPPGSLPSMGLGRGRGGGCRGRQTGSASRAWRGWAGPGFCSFPASARLVPNARGGRAALPASRPCPARTRQLSRAPCEPSRSPYPFCAPCVALPAPRRAPALACAALRAPPPRWTLRVRGLSRRADSALGLPRPPRARARPGDTALLPGRARALLRPRRPPGPSPATHKGWPRARPGDRGGARPSPLCSRLRGALRAGRSRSASWPGGGAAARLCVRCARRGRRGAGLSHVPRLGADVRVSVDTFVFGR